MASKHFGRTTWRMFKKTEKSINLLVSWSNRTSTRWRSLVSCDWWCSRDLSSENTSLKMPSINCSQSDDGTWFLPISSLIQPIAASATVAWPSHAGRQPSVAKWNTLESSEAGAWAAAVCSGTQLKTCVRHWSDWTATAATAASNVKCWRPAELGVSLLCRRTPEIHQRQPQTSCH